MRIQTESRERSAVRSAYRGAKWEKKVDNMSEAQVIAIYKRLKAQNKL